MVISPEFFIVIKKAVDNNPHFTNDFLFKSGENISLNEVLNIYVVFSVVYLNVPIFNIIKDMLSESITSFLYNCVNT